MNQKISVKEHEEIIKMYLDLIPAKTIAINYNVSFDAIMNIAKKYNIPSQKKLFHLYNDKTIIEMYTSGFSSIYIANYYNVDPCTIRSILRSNNISIRNKSECHRKYSLNENYFDKIDTCEKAYFIGLLYADGYNDGNGHVSISLQEKDIDILNKFQKAIDSNEPLNFRNFKKYSDSWSNQYRLLINSKHVSDMLSNYGMVPNKSKILEFPNWLDSRFYKDFIRGYWDGDGHIGKNYIGVIGSENFIEKIKLIFETLFSCTSHIYDKGSVKSLHITKKIDYINVLNYLYKDSTVYLDRKYNSYLSIVA